MQLNFYIMLAEAVIILFELRSLMQSSGIDYYHPATQLVVKLTEPVMKLLPFRNKNIKGFYYAGFIVAFVLSLMFWFGFVAKFGETLNITAIIMFAALMTIKSFGYLLLFLLLAQALCSWLPATRGYSFMFGQLTYPIVAPVQKIIPPIGMIDISLMIVMIAIFALNRLAYSIFGLYWAIL